MNVIRGRDQAYEGEVQDLIERDVRAGRARFAVLSAEDGRLALFLGAKIVVSVPEHDAAIVGMVLTIDALRLLRDECEHLLRSLS